MFIFSFNGKCAKKFNTNKSLKKIQDQKEGKIYANSYNAISGTLTNNRSSTLILIYLLFFLFNNLNMAPCIGTKTLIHHIEIIDDV